MRINWYLKIAFGSVLAAWDLSVPKVPGELFRVYGFCDLFSRHFQACAQCCSEPEPEEASLGMAVLSPGDGQDLCFLLCFPVLGNVSALSVSRAISQKKAKYKQDEFQGCMIVSKGSFYGNDNFLVFTNYALDFILEATPGLDFLGSAGFFCLSITPCSAVLQCAGCTCCWHFGVLKM